MSHSPVDTGRSCEACRLSASRRDFIRDVTMAVGGVLASLGLSSDRADALPVSTVEGTHGDSSTVTYPIPAADGARIDRKNEVILVRWMNAAYAFNLACPHQNVAIRWNDKEHRFKCPKHNSRYEPDGTFVDGRATRGLDRFTIALEGTMLVVDVNAMHKQDVDAAGWTAAVVKLPTGAR